MSDQDDSIIIQVSRTKSNSPLLSNDISNNKGGQPKVHIRILKYDFQKECGVQSRLPGYVFVDLVQEVCKKSIIETNLLKEDGIFKNELK
eukprot:15129886-Ditylum_brightwellii.AAC.1